MPDRVGHSQAWREAAVTAAYKRLWPQFGYDGKRIASDKAVRALAESIVDSIFPMRYRTALELIADGPDSSAQRTAQEALAHD